MSQTWPAIGSHMLLLSASMTSFGRSTPTSGVDVTGCMVQPDGQSRCHKRRVACRAGA